MTHDAVLANKLGRPLTQRGFASEAERLVDLINGDIGRHLQHIGESNLIGDIRLAVTGRRFKIMNSGVVAAEGDLCEDCIYQFFFKT